MRVLLSIKPEFAFRIFKGLKRYEYRRAIFKRTDVERVLVYASSPIQKVIGEFEIDTILSGEPVSLWQKTKAHAGISRESFFDYFADVDTGYAIRVKNCQMYERPFGLMESLGVSPPQSFLYLNSTQADLPTRGCKQLSKDPPCANIRCNNITSVLR